MKAATVFWLIHSRAAVDHKVARAWVILGIFTELSQVQTRESLAAVGAGVWNVRENVKSALVFLCFPQATFFYVAALIPTT